MGSGEDHRGCPSEKKWFEIILVPSVQDFILGLGEIVDMPLISGFGGFPPEAESFLLHK